MTFVPVLQRGHHKEPNGLVGALFEDGGGEALVRPPQTCSQNKRRDVSHLSVLFQLEGDAVPGSASRCQAESVRVTRRRYLEL